MVLTIEEKGEELKCENNMKKLYIQRICFFN